MQRAAAAVQAKDLPLALELLDKVVVIEPDWVEAWNKRATARFMTSDVNGAMADIDRVLKIEPRHFGALSGMGFILEREGLDKRALEVFRHVLTIYPGQPDMKKLVDKLAPEVEGRDI
jgi:tetratricopeptide (TPR) repeat protein